MEIVRWATSSAPFAGNSTTRSVLPAGPFESWAPETKTICEAFQAERRYWRLATPDTPSVRRSREGDQVSDTIRRPSELAPRSEERRVGKECRSRGWAEHGKKRESMAAEVKAIELDD